VIENLTFRREWTLQLDASESYWSIQLLFRPLPSRWRPVLFLARREAALHDTGPVSVEADIWIVGSSNAHKVWRPFTVRSALPLVRG